MFTMDQRKRRNDLLRRLVDSPRQHMLRHKQDLQAGLDAFNEGRRSRLARKATCTRPTPKREPAA